MKVIFPAEKLCSSWVPRSLLAQFFHEITRVLKPRNTVNFSQSTYSREAAWMHTCTVPWNTSNSHPGSFLRIPGIWNFMRHNRCTKITCFTVFLAQWGGVSNAKAQHWNQLNCTAVRINIQNKYKEMCFVKQKGFSVLGFFVILYKLYWLSWLLLFHLFHCSIPLCSSRWWAEN